MTSNDTEIAVAGSKDDITKKMVEDSASGDNKGSKRPLVRTIIDVVIIGLLIGLDQFTKYLAVIHLKNKPAYVLLRGVFELQYLENRGAAFGIMQNAKYFFLAVAVLMVIFVLYTLIKLPLDKKYILMEICLILIGSGAVGNMIDRGLNDYVVDFFYFVLINFPIFNVADIYVTVACFILILGILFVYKEDDLGFLKRAKKKSPNSDHRYAANGIRLLWITD